MAKETSRPFEGFGKAVIVLVSSDDKRIECHKEHLSASSSFFRNMLEASHEGETDLPEVKMAESYEQLSALLPYSYPQRLTPIFSEWSNQSLRSLYISADKLELVRAMEVIEKVMITQPSQLPLDSLGNYSFACKHELPLLAAAVRPFVKFSEAAAQLEQLDGTLHADLGSRELAQLILYWKKERRILDANDVYKAYATVMQRVKDGCGKIQIQFELWDGRRYLPDARKFFEDLRPKET